MNYDELRRTTKNTKELANPSADLRYKKAETYSCRSVVESRRRCLDRLRLMQRPRLKKTKCSVTAVELERHRGCERRKKEKNVRWLRILFIRKGAIGRRERRGGQNDDYPANWTPQFWKDI